jgi:hypothetical protein
LARTDKGPEHSGHSSSTETRVGDAKPPDRAALQLKSAHTVRTPHDRYLRHIYVNGVPSGLTLIQQGWANARYDSLDGDDRHIRQDEYRSADGPHNCGIRAD